MTEQLDEQLREHILRAAADDAGDPELLSSDSGVVQRALESYIDGLTVGRRLNSSPLIKVIEVDDEQVTFLIRGRINVISSVLTCFVRAEYSLGKFFHGDGIRSFIGDAQFIDTGGTVFEIKLGVGYERGVISGRGGVQVVPVGFGLDVVLGGLNDRGVMLGIDLRLPCAIPLGPTGLGLGGFGGDYAHNFRPRLETGLAAEGPLLDLTTGETPSDGGLAPIADPTAINYIQWARNPDDALDRWIPVADHVRSMGFGARCAVVDVASNGKAMLLWPAGIAVLVPGPVLILGGKGKLLHSDALEFNAFGVIDIASRTFALGGGANIEITEAAPVLSGKGGIDMFFSFVDGRAWYINIGTPSSPNSVKFRHSLEAKLYFQINHTRTEFGVEVIYKREIGAPRLLRVFYQASLAVRHLFGWNPRQTAGYWAISGEAGILLWKFKMSFGVTGKVYAHMPRPRRIEAELELKVKMPFPLPDKKVKFKAPRDREDVAPILEPPFEEPGPPVAALHPFSGRQWDLDAPPADPADAPWPDVILTVSFNRRLIDDTGADGEGTVIGAAVTAHDSGGYLVGHRLRRLEIENVETGEVMAGVQACWAEGPATETAILQVLGRDPYVWLGSRTDLREELIPLPAETMEQLFGFGPEEDVFEPRDFDVLSVTPLAPTRLSNAFVLVVGRRVLASNRVRVRLRVPADRVMLQVVERRLSVLDPPLLELQLPGVDLVQAGEPELLFDNIFLVRYEVVIPPGAAVQELVFASLPPDGARQTIQFYSIRFREAELPASVCLPRRVLTPGRYRLRIEGTTEATPPQDMPPAESLAWTVDRSFDIVAPNTLRPYIQDVTVGDPRLFRARPEADNPTPVGLGFPAYRTYVPAVRFGTSDLGEIFERLVLDLTYEGDTAPAWSATGTPVPWGDSADSVLLPSSQDFLDWAGCTPRPPLELSGAGPLPRPGIGEMRLSVPTEGGLRTLDAWSCAVSRFTDFADHMAGTPRELRTLYGRDGPQTLRRCIKPFEDEGLLHIGMAHLDPLPPTARPTTSAAPPPLLPHQSGPFSPVPPAELAAAPPLWRLPAALAELLDTGSTGASAHLSFAAASGVRLAADADDPLEGIGNTVSETTLEALVDDAGRPTALWLRTPEPVDWRRVQVQLRIWHVDRDEGCPTRRANRMPLDLLVHVLPGMDGTSALLVGAFGGVPVALPRGEYEMMVAFDPLAPGLAPLRLRPGAAQPIETVLLRVLQTSGLPWPRPGDPQTLPSHLISAILAIGQPGAGGAPVPAPVPSALRPRRPRFSTVVVPPPPRT